MFASVPSAMLSALVAKPVPSRCISAKGLPWSPHRRPSRRVDPRGARSRAGSGARRVRASTGRNHLITISLAPCDGRKTGSGLDLAIAVGVLVVAGFIDRVPDRGPGVHRRTRSRRLGATDPRCRADRRGDRRQRRRRAASTLVEANIAARGRSIPCGRLRELLATLCDGEPWPDHEPSGAPCHRAGARTRPLRGPGPAARPAGARDRRGRRTPHACSWARRGRARRCSPPACPASCPPLERGAGARSHDGPLRRRRAASAVRAHRAATVPSAAPHQFAGRRSSAADRRWRGPER